MKTGRRGFFGIFAGMAAGAAAIVKADPVSAVASVVPPVSPPAPIPPASLPFRFSGAACTSFCSIVTSSFVMAPYTFETRFTEPDSLPSVKTVRGGSCDRR